MRSRKERSLIFLTFFVSCLAIAFISAAMGTSNWVYSQPKRNYTALSINPLDKDSGRFNGDLNFGLFKGEKVLDSGLGSAGREKKISVFHDYVEAGLFSYGLWVTTIIAACIAILWGLVAAIFAVVNTATKPIETITGPMGLYFWNSLAMLFGIASIAIWVVLYYKYFKVNVLVSEDLDNYWSSSGYTRLGWSFWLLVGGTLCFALNILIIVLSGIQIRPFMKNSGNMNDKNIDMVIMY